jgi:drug/metabolite transporter (DMT)-like permease
MQPRRLAIGSLAVAAALFGMTFVAIKDAVTVIDPLVFVGWRFLVAAAVLLAARLPRGRRIWRDGAIAGVLLFVGYASQTIGLGQTSAANSGLITGLYVVFTPVMAALFRWSRPAVASVAGAMLSMVGLWFLTASDGLSLGVGDLWTLLCAVAFAAHIVALAGLAPRHPVVPFTAVQLLVTAALGLGLAAVLGQRLVPPRQALATIVATALVVTCGAFLIQVWAQTIVGPSRTAIVLALEPVFALITAMVVLGERLTVPAWIGAGSILLGTYIVLVLAPPEDADIRAAEALSEAH